MGFFDNWPYTDMHRLNLDWVLQQMKELGGAFDELEEFVKDPGRFLPRLADPLEWDVMTEYGQYYIVTHEGDGYISRETVPAGTSLTNTEYWVKISEFNAQVAHLGEMLEELGEEVSTNTGHIAELITGAGEQGEALETLENRVITNESAITDLQSKGLDPVTGKRLLFIGDSYLQGYKAGGVNWGAVLAGMGAPTSTHIQAEGSAGFATAGQQGHTFAQLASIAAETLEWQPDMVIACGGINDVGGKTPSQIAQGAVAMLEAIFTAWPTAQVHIFMPFTCYGWGGNFEECADAVQFACATYDTAKRVAFHSGAWTWLYNKPAYYDSDKIHPTAAGQRAIANCIFNELSGIPQTVYHDKWSQGAVSVERDYTNLQINIAAPVGAEYSQGDTIATLPEAFSMFFSIVPCWTSGDTAFVNLSENTITLYSDSAHGLYGSFTTAMNGGL